MGKVLVKTLSSNCTRSAVRWAVALSAVAFLTAGVAGCDNADDEQTDSLEGMTSTIDYEDGSRETPGPTTDTHMGRRDDNRVRQQHCSLQSARINKGSSTLPTIVATKFRRKLTPTSASGHLL